MHFGTDARPAEIPAFVNRVIAIIGAAPWQQREQDFVRQIKENALLERYLDDQFNIERSMVHARNHLRRTGRLPAVQHASAANLGALYAFCGVTALAFHRSSSQAQRALRQRFLGALKDNVGLAPIAFEMRTVAHFMAKGLDVEFHDLNEVGGYDFLVRNTKIEMEVECKSVSGDLGRQVHLLRQYQLGPHIFDSMRRSSKDGVVRLLVATLPARLYGQREFMSAVGARISQTLTDGNDFLDFEPCSIRYGEYPIRESPFNIPSPAMITESQVAEYCSAITGDEVGHTIMMFSPRRSATVVALRSLRPDRFLKSLYRNLTDAAASQLSGTRPGAICVQLRNLTTIQLRGIAELPLSSGKPTAIQRMMAEFFDSDARSHVHTVTFVAPGDFVAQQSMVPDFNGLRRDTTISEDAASYLFINKKHPEVNNPLCRLFG